MSDEPDYLLTFTIGFAASALLWLAVMYLW